MPLDNPNEIHPLGTLLLALAIAILGIGIMLRALPWFIKAVLLFVVLAAIAPKIFAGDSTEIVCGLIAVAVLWQALKMILGIGRRDGCRRDCDCHRQNVWHTRR